MDRAAVHLFTPRFTPFCRALHFWAALQRTGKCVRSPKFAPPLGKFPSLFEQLFPTSQFFYIGALACRPIK